MKSEQAFHFSAILPFYPHLVLLYSEIQRLVSQALCFQEETLLHFILPDEKLAW